MSFVATGFDIGVTIDSGVSVGALTINSEDDEDDVVDVSVLECSIVSGDTFWLFVAENAMDEFGVGFGWWDMCLNHFHVK